MGKVCVTLEGMIYEIKDKKVCPICQSHCFWATFKKVDRIGPRYYAVYKCPNTAPTGHKKGYTFRERINK